MTSEYAEKDDSLEGATLAPGPDLSGAEAPPEGPQPVGAESLSKKDLEGLQSRLESTYQGIQSQITQLEGRLGTRMVGLQSDLRETKKSLALVKQFSEGLLTPEDAAALKAQADAGAEKERLGELEAENKLLKERPGPDRSGQAFFEMSAYPVLVRKAKQNGIDEGEFIRLWDGGWGANVGLRPAGLTDKAEIERILDVAEPLIEAEADRREKAQQPKPRNDSTRPAGHSNSSEQRYRAWLAGKGPQPSSEEIDALTAKYGHM